MRIWDLPGAQRFIDSTCDLLRGGNNVVIRFPGEVPEGFEAIVVSSLGNMLEFGSAPVTETPLQDIARRYAKRPEHINRVQGLCDDPGFQGRLVWLRCLEANTWPAWCDFLCSYAAASRSRPLLGRSLFLVLLAGFPPVEPPPTDIGLTNLAWNGVLDEIDLLLFATERLRGREGDTLLRSLLATTVARVAVWDFDTATALLAENNDTIMNPRDLLRTIAQDKSWTKDTPLDWRLGTASGEGIAHPARVALDNSPSELDRRLWSAQLSILLPWIETCRHETVATNAFEIKRLMRADGNGYGDPFALEVGELARLFSRRGADRNLRKTVRYLQKARNNLAHRRHIPYSSVLNLIGEI